jgi:hypothetical protein
MRESPVNRLEPHWPQPIVSSSTREEPSWSDTAKSWEVDLKKFIGDHPKVTLLAGAAVGLIVGWLVKRK